MDSLTAAVYLPPLDNPHVQRDGRAPAVAAGTQL